MKPNRRMLPPDEGYLQPTLDVEAHIAGGLSGACHSSTWPGCSRRSQIKDRENSPRSQGRRGPSRCRPAAPDPRACSSTNSGRRRGTAEELVRSEGCNAGLLASEHAGCLRTALERRSERTALLRTGEPVVGSALGRLTEKLEGVPVGNRSANK